MPTDLIALSDAANRGDVVRCHDILFPELRRHFPKESSRVDESREERDGREYHERTDRFGVQLQDPPEDAPRAPIGTAS